MNIDWSKAPEGATHWNPENRFFYRFGENPGCWADDGIGWTSTGFESPELYAGVRWVLKVDQCEQSRQAIIDLAAKQCGLSGDSISQLATVLAAEGYRKFEIVEEDV